MHINSLQGLGTVASLILAGLAQELLAVDYSFINIADTTTPLGTATFYSFHSTFGPAISGSNVAFMGGWSDSESSHYGIVTRDVGGPVTPFISIAQLGDPAPYANFDYLQLGGIDGEDVSFGAHYPHGTGAFVGRGAGTSSVGYVGWPEPTMFTGVSDDTAISGLDVVFEGRYEGTDTRGIFKNGAPVFTNEAPDNSPVGGRFDFFANPVISGNSVAFLGWFDNRTRKGLFAVNGTQLVTIALDNVDVPSISGSNVAYRTSGSSSGIYFGSGGPLTKIVAVGDLGPSDPFTSFGNPAISGSTVAFRGTLGDYTISRRGIFTGNGGPLTTVIETGDPLFGSVVVSLEFNRFGLDPHGSGNMAFWYALADGRSGIAMAYLPGPPGPPQEGPGSSPSNPQMPESRIPTPPTVPLPPNEDWKLIDRAHSIPTVNGGWHDPPAVGGYMFSMDSGLFTWIADFPIGFNQPFEVWVGETSLGEFGPGQQVNFTGYPGGGVSSFAITGIDPLVYAEDPVAFPIRLAFDTEDSVFLMTGLVPSIEGDFDNDGDVDGRDFLNWQRNPSIGDLSDWQANYGMGTLIALSAVPEPASFILVCVGSLMLTLLHRGKRLPV